MLPSKNNKDGPQNQEEKILVDIEKFGWTIILVEGTDYLPTFAYTIGLYKNYHHPEIIAFGLDLETLQDVLNGIGESIKEGLSIEIGKNYPEIFEESRTEFIKVDEKNIEDYFGYAIDFYEDTSFPAYCLIWSDDNNRLPWEEKYDKNLSFIQPLLDRNMSFKFLEEKEAIVFTDYRFPSHDSLITRVVHDEEGDWYFQTRDSRPGDMREYVLKEMIIADPSLNEVFFLDYGEQMIRSSKEETWTRSKM